MSSRSDTNSRGEAMSSNNHNPALGVSTISLANEDDVKEVVVNSILGLWEVVNNLTRLQPTRRDRYRVTIFGSARAKPGTLAYEETKRVATALAERGCDIITGGGPGLMRAPNEGVEKTGARSKSLGIRVDLLRSPVFS